MKYSKKYVDVTLKVNSQGSVRPLCINWEDGRIYNIDRVRDICRAASTKAGGCGTRYTIVVEGRQTYLFREEDRWFVEAKEG